MKQDSAKPVEVRAEDLLAAFPGVRVDHDNAAYYQGLLERRLVLNQCTECSTWHHPPRPICPACWSSAVTPRDVTGSGTVALVTILRQGPRQTGVDYEGGHVLVAVELDEQPGVRVAGTVIGVPAEQIGVGDRVRLVWTDIDGAAPRPDFELAQ
ncbi:MAG: putative OB-fold protein [Acidimicrobiales bacterium]|jgi:uncharacterized protein